MAFGIISLTIFIIFMIWALITAPSGPKQVQPTGSLSSSTTLASSFMVSLLVHDFITHSIMKCPNPEEYKSIVRYSYIFAFMINLFSALGSFGKHFSILAIVNRHPQVSNPQLINDYFKHGEWQLVVLEIVYLMTAVTAFPGLVIVSKYFFVKLRVRFFQAFKVELDS